MKQPNETQVGPTVELATVKQRLQREILRRKTAEGKFKESRQHYNKLLAQSLLMQLQLRNLSHRLLLAQEEERKLISRELHDEISQILTGINVQLSTLEIEAATNNQNLKRKIASTQRLVEKSVDVVHRFARKLRPAMLDDLGLIPALLAFMKEFGNRTGILIDFISVPTKRIGPLDCIKRTVLYRVAQEALTNVEKHAKASRIKVSLQLEQDAVCMEIRDNGSAFSVERELKTRRRKHLGIVGMRERVEMVGGVFSITSTPEQGTVVIVKIPFEDCEKPEDIDCAMQA